MLLVGVPGLLREIVRDALEGHDDIELGVESNSSDPLGAVREFDPATLVWCGPNPPVDHSIQQLLYDHPRLRILAITGEGTTGVLHELVPRASEAHDLSPDQLLNAVRGGRLKTD